MYLERAVLQAGIRWLGGWLVLILALCYLAFFSIVDSHATVAVPVGGERRHSFGDHSDRWRGEIMYGVGPTSREVQ